MVELLTIRQARQRKGMTLERAGSLLGVGRNNVWQWEVGRVNPRDVGMFNILLKAYDIHLSIDDLNALNKTLRKGVRLDRIKFKVVTG